MYFRLHSNLFKVQSLDSTFNFYEKIGLNPIKSVDAVRVKPNDFTLAFIKNENNLALKSNSVIYIEIENVDQFTELLKTKDINFTNPITKPWLKRETEIIDPDGITLVFFSKV